jgi:actin-related protein 2
MLISGGTTMFPGFPTRLKNEVEAMYRQRILKNSSAKGAEIAVIDSPTRKYNVFIGAAFIAKATMGMDTAWITREQYE